MEVSNHDGWDEHFARIVSLGVVWRIKCTDSALVCAAGSRNSTEDTKVILLDFDRTTIHS